MAWVGAVLAVVSTVMNVSAQKKEEEAIKRANYKRAGLLEERATQVIAASQRDMLREREQKELVASRAIALAAAGGSDVSSPDIMNIIGDIEGEGAYRESVALYQGEQEAYELRTEAENLRSGIVDLESAGRTRRAATAISGASSAYGAYSKAYPSGGGSGSSGGFDLFGTTPAYGYK